MSWSKQLFCHLYFCHAVQASEEGSIAHKWHLEHPTSDPPEFTAKNFPAKKLNHLPKQDNYCDCGLFALTYIHFFTFAPPEKVNFDHLDKMGGKPSHPSPLLPS